MGHSGGLQARRSARDSATSALSWAGRFWNSSIIALQVLLPSVLTGVVARGSGAERVTKRGRPLLSLHFPQRSIKGRGRAADLYQQAQLGPRTEREAATTVASRECWGRRLVPLPGGRGPSDFRLLTVV